MTERLLLSPVISRPDRESHEDIYSYALKQYKKSAFLVPPISKDLEMFVDVDNQCQAKSRLKRDL